MLPLGCQWKRGRRRTKGACWDLRESSEHIRKARASQGARPERKVVTVSVTGPSQIIVV